MTEQSKLIELTAGIVAAFVDNNKVAASDMPALVKLTFDALSGAETPPAPVIEAKAPAVSIKKSLGEDYLICLEDGRKFKSLKRHLRTKYELSPEAYRAKWNLPKDYPMVAPSYAAARSNLAKTMGLGRKATATLAAPAAAKSAAKKPASKTKTARSAKRLLPMCNVCRMSPRPTTHTPGHARMAISDGQACEMPEL